MRILHVNKYYHTRDGVGRYLFDLMRLSEEAGYVTAALAMHDPRNLPSAWEKFFISEMETERPGFGLHAVKQTLRSFWSREAYKKTLAMLDAFRPDVVHVHNLYTHLSPSVLSACRKRGVPVVMTVHDYALVSANYSLWSDHGVVDPHALGLLASARSRFVKNSFLVSLVQESIFTFHRLFKLYDGVIDRYLTLSEFVRDVLTFSGYDKKKISVVPALAHPLLEPLKEISEREKKSALFAGRLESYKGVSTYLKLGEQFPDYTFYVAGVGPLEAEVLEASAKHENIEYLGFLPAEDLMERMASVQVVVVPSVWYEPFGLVALEAMSLGTPVLAGDAGGLPELVRKSKGGRVFSAGDVKDMAKKFAECVDEKSWRQLSANAADYAREHHSPDAFLSATVKNYEQAIADHGE